MSELHRWWADDPAERYWLEVSDRDVFGQDLKAPQTNERGRPFWSYELVTAVLPGDVVFHYSKLESSIVGASRVAGSVEPREIQWGARGASARAQGVRPHVRPGWYVPLTDHRAMLPGLRLEEMRQRSAEWKAQLATQLVSKGAPAYFPFEVNSKRLARPLQGYLFKLPAFFVAMFPRLAMPTEAFAYPSLEDAGSTPREGADTLGTTYRSARPTIGEGARRSGEVDPGVLERGFKGHADTQNALAEFLRRRGLSPLSPGPRDPDFDLAWMVAGTLWVAEVKSITKENEERQLRLGLGQVVRYRAALVRRLVTRAVLVPERAPTDPEWKCVCESVGVVLAPPGEWEALPTSG